MNKLFKFLLLLCLFIFCVGDASVPIKNRYPLYQIASKTEDGSQIILNDGSIWVIPWIDQFKTMHWNVGDEIEPLYYTVGKGLLSSFYWFTFNNKTKNENGTGYQGENPDIREESVWISEIDKNQSRVKLNNGTVFQFKKTNKIEDWNEGDAIFVLFGTQAGLIDKLTGIENTSEFMLYNLTVGEYDMFPSLIYEDVSLVTEPFIR
jgi:hypothetical protein